MSNDQGFGKIGGGTPQLPPPALAGQSAAANATKPKEASPTQAQENTPPPREAFGTGAAVNVEA